jgi:hypothetical protein
MNMPVAYVNGKYIFATAKVVKAKHSPISKSVVSKISGEQNG